MRGERVRPDGLAVVGTGSWGVTLAVLAARTPAAPVREPLLLARTAQEADALRLAGGAPPASREWPSRRG